MEIWWQYASAEGLCALVLGGEGGAQICWFHLKETVVVAVVGVVGIGVWGVGGLCKRSPQACFLHDFSSHVVALSRSEALVLDSSGAAFTVVN